MIDRLRALARSALPILAMVAQAGCSPSPDPERFLTAPQLTNLVVDRTVEIRYGASGNSETMIFLARDGTGWFADGVQAGFAPMPGSISMVLRWRLYSGSRVCLWATPTIGAIPLFAPVERECLQVLLATRPYEGLNATVTSQSHSRAGWLSSSPNDAFPQPVISAYLDQLRVLFGGQMPRWPIFATMPPPA